MNDPTIFLFALIGAAVTYLILYFVIKAAVRDGLLEAKRIVNSKPGRKDMLPQVNCPECNKSHDFDYPKCPHCGHEYQ